MFGSIRFFTKNTDDMVKLCNHIYGNPDWIDDEGNDCVDFTELLLTTEDDGLNCDLFDSSETAISAVNDLFEKAGVTVNYKVFCEGNYPDKNFTIVNGNKVQQYALSEDENVYNTYQAVVDCIEDGDIYLGYFDETNYVEIGAYYKGELVNSRTVIIETDETGSDCYSRIDDEEYNLTVCSTDLVLADSVWEFHDMSDDELTEKCVEYFSKDDNARDEFLDECRDQAESEIPDDVAMSEFTFKVLPLEKPKSSAVQTSTSVETPSTPAAEPETPSLSSPAQKVKCPNCGTENDAGISFCETCGTKLDGAPVAERVGRPSLEDRLNKMQSDMDAKLDSFFGKK